MTHSVFYDVKVIQLPERVRSWVSIGNLHAKLYLILCPQNEYSIQVPSSETGYEWCGDELNVCAGLRLITFDKYFLYSKHSINSTMMEHILQSIGCSIFYLKKVRWLHTF
jgi:hypothetical protein